MGSMPPNLICPSLSLLNDDNKPDYFDRLPGTILIEILDRLPMEDAVSTTFLSKRWKNLWKEKQNIEIGCRWEEKTGEKVLASLPKIFDSLAMKNLHSICVSLHDRDSVLTTIQSLIAYASLRNVRELHIGFDDKNAYSVSWTRRFPCVLIPECELRPCLALVKLSLKSLELQTFPSSRFRVLKELYLELVILDANSVETVTDNCPLTLLCLSNCNPERHMYIIVAESSNLHHLIIREDMVEVNNHTYLFIRAPNVRVLDFGLGLPRRRYEIQGSLYCLEATFRLNYIPSSLQAKGVTPLNMRLNFTENFMNLLEKLRAVKVLTLSSLCIQILTTKGMNWRRPLTFDVTHLFLETAMIQWEYKGVAYMLLGCSKLEKLVVAVAPPAEFDFNLMECVLFYSKYVNFRNILQELKIVEFRNRFLDEEFFNKAQFFGNFKFGKLLYRNLKTYSKNLEKIVFTTRRSRSESSRLGR